MSPIPGDALDATPPKTVHTAYWEDFIDIFHSPSAVFARRENGNAWIPIVVLTVLLTVLFLAGQGVLSPLMDSEFNRRAAEMMKRNPNLTADRLASMRHFQEMFAPVFVLVAVPISIFVTAVVLWVVGKIVDATESLRTAVIVTAYAMVPKVVDSIVSIVQAMFMDPSSLTNVKQLSLGPARFLNPDTTAPLALALLGRLDIFTIWITVLLAIGLAVTGRIPRTRAAVAAVVVWLLGSVPGIIQAVRS